MGYEFFGSRVTALIHRLMTTNLFDKAKTQGEGLPIFSKTPLPKRPEWTKRDWVEYLKRNHLDFQKVERNVPSTEQPTPSALLSLSLSKDSKVGPILHTHYLLRDQRVEEIQKQEKKDNFTIISGEIHGKLEEMLIRFQSDVTEDVSGQQEPKTKLTPRNFISRQVQNIYYPYRPGSCGVIIPTPENFQLV